LTQDLAFTFSFDLENHYCNIAVSGCESSVTDTNKKMADKKMLINKFRNKMLSCLEEKFTCKNA